MAPFPLNRRQLGHRAGAPDALFYAILTQDPVYPDDKNITPALEDVVNKLLCKNPINRLFGESVLSHRYNASNACAEL